jgi:hypothetical protein
METNFEPNFQSSAGCGAQKPAFVSSHFLACSNELSRQILQDDSMSDILEADLFLEERIMCNFTTTTTKILFSFFFTAFSPMTNLSLMVSNALLIHVAQAYS